MRVVPSWEDLEEPLAGRGIDGVVVDADFPDRAAAIEVIQRLRQWHPHLAIVAYADFRTEAEEVYRLGGIGVDGVLLADRTGDARATCHSVERAIAGARAGRVGETVRGRHGDLGGRAVAWAMEHARERPTASAMAAALGHTRTSLAKALRSVDLPPPRRLLVWGRLLLAGAYLGRDGHTVEQTAFMVGYANASSLTRAMTKEVGVPPAEVARRGGLSYVHGVLFADPRPGESAAGLLRPVRILTLLGLLLVGAACGGLTASSGIAPAPAIDAVLDAPPVDQVHFGILAVENATGRVLYARNAHRKFVPASNQKILVTATALTLLGPDYAFETELWGTDEIRGGTLHGDLVLPARGDPTLSSRYHPSGEAALAALADSLRRAGLRRVTGSLVVDASAWDSTSVGPTWEVEDLRWRYAATGGAFALEEGELRVEVRGGANPGEEPAVRWWPRGTADFVTSALTTVPADSATRVRPSYLPEQRRLVLHGTVAAGSVDTLSFAQRDPVRQATASLHRALEAAGIEVDGGWRVVWRPNESLGGWCASGRVHVCGHSVRLAALASPSLELVVAGILEPSQNWMTEQLVHVLGYELGSEGSWSEGLRVVREFLVETVGVDSLDVAPRDGSGLSAYNLVTPRALVAVLRHMAAGPYAAQFRSALAEPGEEGSTLRRRLSGLEGRVFAKTGTISNVNSLSGYLVGGDGREIVFSILSNGSGLPSATVRAAIDRVVEVLAR